MPSHADQIQSLIERADALLKKHHGNAQAFDADVANMIAASQEIAAALMSCRSYVETAVGPQRGRQSKAKIDAAAHQARNTVARLNEAKLAIQATWVMTQGAQLAMKDIIRQLNSLQ